MKVKKILPLSIMSILLTSCKPYDYSGTYSFMMGKQKEAHVGIKLVLTNEYADEDNHDLGKKFELTLDSELTPNADKSEEEKSETQGDLGDFTLDGSYVVTDRLTEDKNYALSIMIGDISAEETSSFDDFPVILLNEVVLAEINKSEVQMSIPVSIKDAIFQLYWYGYDFSLETLEFVEVTKHEHGTHPTKEEVDEINKTYPKEHSLFGLELTYRDFDVLTMGLKKQ